MDIVTLKYNLKRKCMVILLLISANIFCLALTGCSDDDWAPYEEKVDDVSIKLEGNIFKLDECREELTSICSQYAEDLLLVEAEYIFLKNAEDYAVISMSKDYEKNKVGYTIICEVYVDLDKNTVTKIKYIDGHSKRVRSSSVELSEVTDIQADEIYADIIAALSSNTLENIEKTRIYYYRDKVIINCFDNEGENIYHNSIEV